MLIICSGPDTWHARKKARELMAAFKDKHDKTGFSTETLSSDDPNAVMSQIGTPSIFSPMRMIRCDGLLDGLKAAQVKLLAKRLQSDGDKTIVMSVEDEIPKEGVLKEFKGVNVVNYSYPLLTGKAFEKWCVQRGAELNVAQVKAVEISQRNAGDVWQAEQELMKCGAYAGTQLAESDMDPGSVFDASDKYYFGQADWRSVFHALREEQLTSIVLSQGRSALRVQDNQAAKLPYFVIKKMQGYKPIRSLTGFFKAARAFLASRTGLAASDEVDALL